STVPLRFRFHPHSPRTHHRARGILVASFHCSFDAPLLTELRFGVLPRVRRETRHDQAAPAVAKIPIECAATRFSCCHTLPQCPPELIACACELVLVARHCISIDVLKDGVAAELTPNLWYDDESVRFTFFHAELGDAALDITLVVIVVIRIIELLPARRFKIVDPGQAMAADEPGIETKS